MRVTEDYVFFWDGIYSQWYGLKSEPLFYENQLAFWTAEHYMMYKKAELFSANSSKNKAIMADCLKANHPNYVKGLGRDVEAFDQEVWDKYKLSIVTKGNILKFSQNDHLMSILELHKNKFIVEASPYDKIWGIGLHFDDDAVLDESKWNGENLLGIAIMNTRKALLNVF